jgi:predicted pyridoxine 5'-phosphate oxidase superfamily flavin-nucleotide-binding protein
MPDLPEVHPAAAHSTPFHRGEQAVQERVGVREQLEALGKRMIRNFMPDQHRELFLKIPTVLLGSLDADGQPWASVLAKPSGLITSASPTQLEFHALPDDHDPLQRNLRPGALLGMLGLEPHTRRRNRMNGTVTNCDAQGFVLQVNQSFGNCPKYIQARSVLEAVPASVGPGAVSHSESLTDEMAALVTRADTYFIASASIGEAGEAGEPGWNRGVDMSHRGGKSGFVRVDNGNSLTAPDFAGNFFFNTLGNLTVNPKAGLLFIDYASGDLLHLAVRGEIIWDPLQIKQFAGAQRLMRYQVVSACLRRAALPLRWSEPQFSPVLSLTGAWNENQG